MQNRFLKVLGFTVVSLIATADPSSAEDKIQSFMTPAGKVVFTNLVNNAPAAVQPLVADTDILSREIPLPLKSLVDTIATNHGVDPALVRAVMKTESNFNRWAVSPKGALGLMQLIPATGRRYGVRDFFDPEQNVDGGVRYLKFLLEKFNGNIDLSLAAYNAGENLVERLGRIPAIPETTNYVRRIRALYDRSAAANVLNTSLVADAGKPPVSAKAAAEPETKADGHRIFRTVDERGVLHFSNIEPPN